MLIIKLTRTQLLQQESKLKEERQKLKKLAKKPNSTKSANIKNSSEKLTQKNMPQRKMSGGNLKPKAKTGLRSTCGKKVLNKKNANRSQTVARKPIQSMGVKKPGVSKNTNNLGQKAKLSVGTKFKKVHVSQKKSTGKKIVQKRQLRRKVVSRAAPKRNLTTSKPNAAKKSSQAGSKESRATKNENVNKLGEGQKQAGKTENLSEKKPDCCCSQNSGEIIQSCWMCRLSQRLGGKLIGNKTKLK